MKTATYSIRVTNAEGQIVSSVPLYGDEQAAYATFKRELAVYPSTHVLELSDFEQTLPNGRQHGTGADWE
ncbi:hypothetical protein ACIQI8_27435 [Streptomyces sp. NPDC092369]|uniref:hypothetical protein n=1 Tax=Streptomyces sp. NPDC092369 TaxID=3366015 RepID=UPI00382D2507